MFYLKPDYIKSDMKLFFADHFSLLPILGLKEKWMIISGFISGISELPNEKKKCGYQWSVLFIILSCNAVKKKACVQYILQAINIWGLPI